MDEIKLDSPFFLQQIETTNRNRFWCDYVLTFVGGTSGENYLRISLPLDSFKDTDTRKLSEFGWELILRRKPPTIPNGYHFVDDWK